MSGATYKRPREYNLTGDDAAPVSFLCRTLRIPADTDVIAAVNSAIYSLTRPENWQPYGTNTPAQQAALMRNLWADYIESSVCMLGTVHPYVTVNPPSHTLPCDGSTHERADYPALYDLLPAALIVSGSQFMTPDLRGRVVLAAGAGDDLTARAPLDQGGAETVTLTTDQMPSHSHTDAGHSHWTHAHIYALAVVPGEVALAGSNPLGEATGAASANLTPTGGDMPHSNMPPFLALNYCIVAR